MSQAVLLDSEGLSRYLRGTGDLAARIAAARRHDAEVYTCAMTVLEAAGPKVAAARVGWALSQIVIEPVTEADARAAHRMLTAAGLHGHKYAIDAVLVALALRLPVSRVVLLTSDPEDLTVLLGEDGGRRVSVVAL
ncbi:hypothetical protein BIV57_04375 [Mangrovactinospora gilvigrisea]|uniref:DNA-binding protein n=1 Tax=Mangrovactinospora gilvigrisea TaxID=1428644 RepID=A0A1J7BJG4_9ACTN|nr:hypothetical protein [Mangrovactinospora gilvigrisea]OIV38725.1 hypothetical protein BIV57_04375 [Mangrovactinospora gilvigrisea]